MVSVDAEQELPVKKAVFLNTKGKQPTCRPQTGPPERVTVNKTETTSKHTGKKNLIVESWEKANLVFVKILMLILEKLFAERGMI